MKKYPFILIFDIDNTVIGDCSLLTKEAQLLEYIYNTCKKEDGYHCKYMENIDMQDELKSGLLRPHINEFIKFCNNKFKNIEIFFYTGSSYWWTNSSLGPNIEKALNIKINRPFFTKENMITTYSKNIEKSIANIFPLITKSLEGRYPVMKNDGDIDFIIKNRTLFIDDIKNNTYTYANRQLVCPRYKYWPVYDVSNKVVKKYGIDPRVFDNKEVLKYMWADNIYIYNTRGNIYQRDREFCNKQKTQQLKYSKLSRGKDRYYKRLIKELSKKGVTNDVISDDTILNINKLLK
jgi:hypothetical protein